MNDNMKIIFFQFVLQNGTKLHHYIPQKLHSTLKISFTASFPIFLNNTNNLNVVTHILSQNNPNPPYFNSNILNSTSSNTYFLSFSY